MEEIFPDIYRTDPEHPFGNEVVTYAYLAARSEGNLLFYASSRIDACFDTIDALGGVTKQLLNHRDEASPACERVRRRYDAPLVCHDAEREAIQAHCTVDHTFTERHWVAPDVLAVPTPGHVPGSTCYLLHHRGTRYLFTGDTIYLHHGEWTTLARDAQAMRKSLQALEEVDFEVLVPGLHIGAPPYDTVPDPAHRRTRLQRCQSRLGAAQQV